MERPPKPKYKKGYVTKWNKENQTWEYEIVSSELDR